jgi:hypothetical protein
MLNVAKAVLVKKEAAVVAANAAVVEADASVMTTLEELRKATASNRDAMTTFFAAPSNSRVAEIKAATLASVRADMAGRAAEEAGEKAIAAREVAAAAVTAAEEASAAVMRAEEAAAAERAGLSASNHGTYTMQELLRGAYS